MPKRHQLAAALASGLILVACMGGAGNGCTGPAVTPRPPAVTPVTPAPAPVPTDSAHALDQLLFAHNAERSARGLAPFVMSARLVASAQAHAEFMAKAGTLAHFGIGDGDPWGRIAATGYAYSAAGENVAWNQHSVAEVVASWMASPGHRAAILGPYTECGFGLAYGARGDPYWCTDFARP